MPYLLLHQTCSNASGLPAEERQLFDNLGDAAHAASTAAAGLFDAGQESCRVFAESVLEHFGLPDALVPYDGRVSIVALLQSPKMAGRAARESLEAELDVWWALETDVLGYPCWIIQHLTNRDDADGEWCGTLAPGYQLDDESVFPVMEEAFFDAAAMDEAEDSPFSASCLEQPRQEFQLVVDSPLLAFP
ncbi:MAG: hypothetical protein Q8M07_01155, partial [Prosthecobacter sp.]|nr:hypothetical protein [Prosthecobacter sp.]